MADEEALRRDLQQVTMAEFIRATHPYGFRSGQWARLLTTVACARPGLLPGRVPRRRDRLLACG